MRNKKLSLAEAFTWVEKEFSNFLGVIERSKSEIKSYGHEVDAAIHSYIYCLEQWIYGNNMWSFDTFRYFGIDNMEVKRSLMVELRAPKFAM